MKEVSVPTAACMIREQPPERRGAFVAGLSKCGFKVIFAPAPRPGKQDVLVLWGRQPGFEHMIRPYSNVGAKLIITENAWVGTDELGRRRYALCLDHHQGAGTWTEGQEDRWAKLGIKLLPWREQGDHILLLEQRGIGEPGVAMPHRWAANAALRLRRATKRPVRLRPHPGKYDKPLAPDLVNCHACFTWASGAGVKAIINGVPVFYDMLNWVGASAGVHGVSQVEQPFLGNRLPMLRRLAYAQWTIEELSTGFPFRHLLGL